jgi:hypothetical protein
VGTADGPVVRGRQADPFRINRNAHEMTQAEVKDRTKTFSKALTPIGSSRRSRGCSRLRPSRPTSRRYQRLARNRKRCRVAWEQSGEVILPGSGALPPMGASPIPANSPVTIDRRPEPTSKGDIPEVSGGVAALTVECRKGELQWCNFHCQTTDPSGFGPWFRWTSVDAGVFPRRRPPRGDESCAQQRTDHCECARQVPWRACGPPPGK